MALDVGDRLGRYDVTALIGQGGMGEVYRATGRVLAPWIVTFSNVSTERCFRHVSWSSALLMLPPIASLRVVLTVTATRTSPL